MKTSEARGAGSSRVYDAVIVGSGFGGSLIAHTLVNAGLDVLMLERGDWVERGPHNWEQDASVDLTPFYTTEMPYRVLAGGNKDVMGAYSCVGGPSVFYGGVSMRFREADFKADPEIVGDSSAAWPFGYSELEPYYARAEHLLGVAGEAGEDPTEPHRSGPYPHRFNGLSATSRRIADAARSLGLNPFRMPLAINFRDDDGRAACVACTTCDTFACAIGAKNDLATGVLPDLIARGLELQPNTVATRLEVDRGRITSVACHDKRTGESRRVRGSLVFVCAGAIGSPHLLLASGLEELSPAGHTIGRYLMRHCNAIVFGFFLRHPNKPAEFHKQLAIHDFYFGHPEVETPVGKLGSMQQLQSPPVGLVKAMLPWPVGQLLSPGVKRLTGLLVMAEDVPQVGNGVALDPSGQKDRYGVPRLTITHHYADRDLAACNALTGQAKRVLRAAGGLFSYVHHIRTFSHAVGTVRMGDDPGTSALDPYCRFRGVENLYVVDGSFMPTSAGLNPSLTIAATALRVGEHVLETYGSEVGDE
jgi:choline dehydrogenase-like flavoprotein